MRSLFLLLAMLPLIPTAEAASLRPFTSLERRIVRLSDLWDGVAADRDIGPAPAPGARIVVEAPQLAAIARQFGVDWTPATPGDRAILERAGRPLAREAVLSALRTALTAAGAPDEADVDVPAFATPIVAVGSDATPVVSQLSYDAESGRFTALVDVPADGSMPTESRVSGRVVAMMDLPTPVRPIAAGDVIGPADMRLTRVRAPRLTGETVRSPAQAIGFSPRRSLPQGQPILAADLTRPLLVRKGATVRMVLSMPGIALTAEGIAAAPALMGERVLVLNPSSKMLVEAEVTGPSEVRVLPGTTPVPAGPSASSSSMMRAAR